MDRATEIAHRIIPEAGSEWPLSTHGRAIVMEHAANIIRAELAEERRRALEATRDAISCVATAIAEAEKKGFWGPEILARVAIAAMNQPVP